MEKRRDESAKRTAENSPAIYRWDLVPQIPSSPRNGRLNPWFLVYPRLWQRVVRISAVRGADSAVFPDVDPSTEVLGYFHSSAVRTVSFGIRRLLSNSTPLFPVFLIAFVAAASCFAQDAPSISKIDPPSWWIGHSLNPVRVLIRGSNLQGATVQTIGAGLRAGRPRINSGGTYLFVDVVIDPRMKPGRRSLKITTANGSANAQLEVLKPLSPAGRFQGFSPDDVMYLIMIDRFSDGDPSNNDPPQSRGLYDRKNKFYYHGGDLQGVLDHLPYLKDLGVTALWLTPWYDNYDRLNEIELKEGKPCTGFHGYNPQDFYSVEEHFGTLSKLRELVNASHKLGIRIIQDEVVNHTGPYHPWVDDPPRPGWFNGTKQKHLANVFQTWTLHDPRPVPILKKETMEGWFLDFLPDLNQHDPEVARYLIQNTLWWIGITGTDGIRMDTWQYVPNTFWHQWTAAIKREYPHFTVVGEVKDGDVVHTSYFQGGKVRDGADSGLDSLLDFPLLDQQYAYARKTKAGVVVIAINNASKPATIEFDAMPAGLREGAKLFDRLGELGDAQVADRKLKVTLSARSAAVLTPR